MKMTGNSFVLDTNIIAALLKGEAGIADKIDKAIKVYIPIIVLGELYYGALYSSHVQKNIRNIQKVIARYTVLLIDEETTSSYGNIKTSLRKKGKPIPENDIWIAAIALRHNLTVITRDKHFKEIDQITIKHW
jgi:tRNA(fMet)-specific endonuclease VapC